MVAILDHRGQPIRSAELREAQSARVAYLHREFENHPSRGLSPPRLSRILSQAEQGDLIAQADLAEDIEEKDGHVFAELSKRKRALLGLDWHIEPPRNASAAESREAELLEEMVRDLDDFEDVLFDLADAINKGYSLCELEWGREDGRWLPSAIAHRPARWFQVPVDARNELRLRDSSADGAPLTPGGWICHVHKAKSGYVTRAGLARVLAWPYLFKNYSVRDLAEFLEIYGLPLRLGVHKANASEVEKATLFKAVSEIGHTAAGIVPESMRIDFLEAAAGTHQPYQAMLDWCERTQSKAILGGTLTSNAESTGLGSGVANVHNEVRHDLLVSDARQIAGTVSRDLLWPLAALNFANPNPRRAPRFVFETRQPEDMKLYADSLPGLVQAGVRIGRDEVNRRLGFSVPADDEDVLITPGAGTPPAPTSEAAATVALRRGAVPDEFDDLADDLASEWETVLEPVIAPALAAARDATSYEAFLEALPQVLTEMHVDQLTEHLARGQFAARLWGRVNNGD